MMRRIPLWATLLPLVVAALLWRWYWVGWRDQFTDTLRGVLGPASVLEPSGFPYRLAADARPVSVRFAGRDAIATATASHAEFNRQPWRGDLTVIAAAEPRLSFAVPGVRGLDASLAAPKAQGSVHLVDAVLRRVSVVADDADLRLGFLPAPGRARAGHVELHFGETPAARGAPVAQARLVMSGERVRLGGGDPLGVEAMVYVSGREPLRGLAGWSRDGSVRLEQLVLRDATGEVLRMHGDARPAPDGRLNAAGDLTTVCPFTVRAAFLGQPPAPEYRARRAVELRWQGLAAGGLRLVEAAGGLQRLPVRAQAAPCPVIAR